MGQSFSFYRLFFANWKKKSIEQKKWKTGDFLLPYEYCIDVVWHIPMILFIIYSSAIVSIKRNLLGPYGE